MMLTTLIYPNMSKDPKSKSEHGQYSPVLGQAWSPRATFSNPVSTEPRPGPGYTEFTEDWYNIYQQKC